MRILRVVKRVTLMFKSSPRLSKQVDYLLNLVGIYLHVYIYIIKIVHYIRAPWHNVIFYFTVLEIINYLAAVK